MSSTPIVDENTGNAGESSKVAANGIESASYEHAINLTNWIFNVGYLHQDWADVHITFFQSGLKAHRVILARSPYLANMLRNVVPGSTIHLNFVDEFITQESVHIALQHLYSPSHNLINSSNAKSILATAYLFGGMPELLHHSYNIIKSSLESSNVVETINWLSQSSDFLSNGFRSDISTPIDGNCNGNGTSSISSSSTMFGSLSLSDTPKSPTNSTSTSFNEGWESNNNRYGEWTSRLKNDVLNYLLHDIPSKHSNDLTTNQEIINLFSQLPYELFKLLLESKELPIKSMQERFSFTKKIIAQRKKLLSSQSKLQGNNNNNNNHGQMEESVVLAFKGSDQGMEIHISRKPKKSRSLWKVES
ncbi:uncharacterized protein L201_002620 [Kwoniella dendrophila CBS 6074]|uniref:BTB domain-containing protein n=1 Tax=Kwoniella dendrophila CBS 6074 TaxID=1295534 RepID=A0AAX4JS40_9TREE